MNALLTDFSFDDMPDFFGGESNIEEPIKTGSNLSVVAPMRPDADFGYPPSLPIELALKTAPMETIRDAYGLTEDQFLDLMTNPAFVAALKEAQELAKEEGMSFRLKAKLQAEEMLKTSWSMVHDRETPPSVRADLIKSTVRWANLEPAKEQQSPFPPGSGLNIQINLG